MQPPLDQAGDERSPASVAQSPGQSIRALEDVITLPWNDLDLLVQVLRARRNEIAGVVMEPINCNTGAIMPLPGYLEGVREATYESGTVLIFDEVITGFRVALAGAQGPAWSHTGPCDICKSLAGGFPLAALAGKREIMDLLHTGPVMHGGTYNANVVVVAAGLATLANLSGMMERRITT